VMRTVLGFTEQNRNDISNSETPVKPVNGTGR
jgi:hypothetical protein